MTISHDQLSYRLSEIFEEGSDSFLLARAAAIGDTQTVNRLAINEPVVNKAGKHGVTPLWWAAWAQNFEGFSALLRKGADPNSPRWDGLPTMHVVIRYCRPVFLKEALLHGGDPNTVDSYSGETLLMSAALLGQLETINILLAAGADVNAQKQITGRTAPMIALDGRADYKLVWDLLLAGASPEIRDNNGFALADVVAHVKVEPNSEQGRWRAKVIGYLKAKGIDVNL